MAERSAGFTVAYSLPDGFGKGSASSVPAWGFPACGPQRRPLKAVVSYYQLVYHEVDRRNRWGKRVTVAGMVSSNKGRPSGRHEPGRAGSTVRVTEQTHAAVRALAEEMGEPMQDVIAKAVEAYRRQCILERTNAAYAALRADPHRWQEERDEREIWEITAADGVEDE